MPTPFGFDLPNPYEQAANNIKYGPNAAPAAGSQEQKGPISPKLAGKVLNKGIKTLSPTTGLKFNFGPNIGQFLSGSASPWLTPGTTDIINAGGQAISSGGAGISLGTLTNPASQLTSGSGSLSLGSNTFLSGESGLANLQSASPQMTGSAGAGSFANAAAGALGGLAGNYLASISGIGGGREGAALGGTAGAVIGQALIPIPGIGAAIGGFLGNIAGSFFGDDGDFPYARYHIKGGEVGLNDSLDGGPIDEVTKIGQASQNNLLTIAGHYGIPKDSLPDVAIGVASGRKGSNLGSGLWTTINSNGSFNTDPNKVKNWENIQDASADMILKSLQYSNLSGADKKFQDLVLSYDGTNGQEVLSEIMMPVAGSQNQEYVQTMIAAGRTPNGIPLVTPARETDKSTFLDSVRRYKEGMEAQGVA